MMIGERHDETRSAALLERAARRYVDDVLAAHPALRPRWALVAIMLVGSSAAGYADGESDLDLEIVAPGDAAAEIERGVREAAALPPDHDLFVEFETEGIRGHYAVISREDLEHRVRTCDDVALWRMQRCSILHDPAGWLRDLGRIAVYPADVLRARQRRQYIVMAERRNQMKAPLRRADRVAAALLFTQMAQAALRASLLLDGRPYPYDKWLAAEAGGTETGRAALSVIADGVAALGRPWAPGPSRSAPLYQIGTRLRDLVRDAYRARGIDEAWLERWWLFMGDPRGG